MLNRIFQIRTLNLAHSFIRISSKIIIPSSIVPQSHPHPFFNFTTIKQSTEQNIYNEEQIQHWNVDYTKVLTKYPFHHIPITLIRNPSLFKIDSETMKNLTAFKALHLKGNDVQIASQILLPPKWQQYVANQEQSYKGQRIFDFYFSQKIKEFQNALNHNKTSYQQKCHALNILYYISRPFIEQKQNIRLKESNIIANDDRGVLTAYYVRFATKFQQDFIHLLPILMQKLQSKKVDSQEKLQISRILLSTAYYFQYYSQKLTNLTIQTFTTHLQHLQNYQILFTMRYLYNFQSEPARNYGQAIINHIKKKHIQQNNIDFHVPMILKTIRYCNKHKLSSDDLIEFVIKNMDQFKIIFTKKKISKGLLFSLLFQKRNSQYSSDQVVSFLKQFFFDTLRQISKSDQIQEGQIVRVSKLLIKYFNRLSTAEKEQVRQEYLKYIIPHYNHSNEVNLYCLLVVLREKRIRPEEPNLQPKFDRDTEMIKKMIVQYLQSCSTKKGGKLVVTYFINSAIELMYHIHRHELQIPKEDLPSIVKYDWKQKNTVEPETLGFFITYLTHCNEKKEDIRTVLDVLQPQFEIYFQKKKIRSIITVFSILNLCHKVDFEHPYFYRHLQHFIGDYLINNPNFIIQEKDMVFLNKKLVKRGYSSQNLRNFVQDVLKDSSSWSKSRAKYVEKQRKFKDKIKKQKLRR